MELVRERKGIEKKFYDLCLKIVADQGLCLYDMDYLPGNHELRVFIYNEDTKTAVIEDCVKVDKAFDPYMETESWIPESLTLQVSSPGLFRSLKSLDHFKLSLGEKIDIVLGQKVDGLKDKKALVVLKSVGEDYIVVDAEGSELKVPLESIKKAKLETEVRSK